MSANTKCFMSLHNNNTIMWLGSVKLETHDLYIIRRSLVNARDRCHFKCHPKHKIAAHSLWQLLCGQTWGLSVTAIFNNYSFDNGKLTRNSLYVHIYREKKKVFLLYTLLSQSLFSRHLNIAIQTSTLRAYNAKTYMYICFLSFFFFRECKFILFF